MNMWNLPFRSTAQNPNPYSGQALLIILLVMSVVLTTVLSVVSRSVTDISITTYEDESVRALSAAEAGVEEAFISGLSTPSIDVDLDIDSKTSFKTAITASAIGSDEFAHPVKLKSGETTTFWMVSHDANGDLVCNPPTQPCYTGSQIRVFWGKSGTDENTDFTPAIEVSIYYDSGAVQPGINSGDFSNVDVIRVTFDPHNTRSSTNNFTNVPAGSYPVGGREFGFRGTVNIASEPHSISCRTTDGCILMVRVRMFYNSSEAPAPVGLEVVTTGPNGALPAQGITIDSTGTSGNSTRKLRVFRSFPEPLLVFDSSLFSYGSLEK